MTVTQDTLIKQKMRKLKRDEKRLKREVAQLDQHNKNMALIIKGQDKMILDQKEILTARDLEITQLKEDLRNRPPLPTPAEPT